MVIWFFIFLIITALFSSSEAACASSCTSCLNGNICNGCGYQCLTCTSFYACTSCPTGLYLNSVLPGQCIDSDTCLRFYYGYYVKNGTCIKCMTGCQSCDNGTSCKTCMQGYYLDANKQCITCPDGCTACISATICTNCYNDHFMENNMCIKCVDGCGECSNLDYCTHCWSNYYFYPYNGKPFNSSDGTQYKPYHCYLKCPQDSNWYGYIGQSGLQAGECNQCPSNCMTCGPSGCITCLDGYTLIQGACYDCNKACSVPNCDTYQSCNNTCIEGYVVNGYNPTATAMQCIRCGAMFNGCKTCTNEKCLSCYDDYYMVTVAGYSGCYACQMGCSRCSDSYNCFECKPNYYYYSNSYSHFVSVYSPYDYFGATCYQNCPLDSSWHGYTKTNPEGNGTCIQCASNCARCDDSGCLQCLQGYELNNGMCLTCQTNCQGSNSNGGSTGNSDGNGNGNNNSSSNFNGTSNINQKNGESSGSIIPIIVAVVVVIIVILSFVFVAYKQRKKKQKRALQNNISGIALKNDQSINLPIDQPKLNGMLPDIPIPQDIGNQQDNQNENHLNIHYREINDPNQIEILPFDFDEKSDRSFHAPPIQIAYEYPDTYKPENQPQENKPEEELTKPQRESTDESSTVDKKENKNEVPEKVDEVKENRKDADVKNEEGDQAQNEVDVQESKNEQNQEKESSKQENDESKDENENPVKLELGNDNSEEKE